MRKLFVILVLILFLVSFLSAKNITEEKNKIKIGNRECPTNCTCAGSMTKCFLSNGTREMTITAGKSGNIIIQVKGVNASTKVTLYKSDDGKLYAVNKNNETRIIRLLPDQVREKIRARLSRQLEKETITLNENGTYDYKGEKNMILLFFFHVQGKVRAELDSETGKIIKIKHSWWAFLAKDEGEKILGASCGTVTPGENDNCCKSKDFDFYNAETSECEFSKE